LDKKMLTIFIITFVVIAGTAAASFWSTTTTKTIQFGSSPALSTTTTTTALSNSKAENTGITVVRTSSDDNLVSALLRILGLQVDVDEITTFRGRNMGYGEITLAYNLAHASGKSVHQILDMRYEEKMGWGKIANTLGVKLHDKADNAQLILRDAQLNDDADKFKIDIQVDLDDEDKEDKHFNNTENNSHKPEHNDDHKNPHQNQGKPHGKKPD